MKFEKLQRLIMKVMEDESIRINVGIIYNIVRGIISYGETQLEDEVIWKILKSLTPPFKTITQMIQLMIPCTKNFTKETLLGRLEAIEFDLKQSGELAKVEMTFSALSVRPSLERSTSVRGDFANISNTIEEKINEGVALLVEIERDGKKFFKCWTCNEYGHYASKCPKREKNFQGRFRSRRPRDCFYANEEEE